MSKRETEAWRTSGTYKIHLITISSCCMLLRGVRNKLRLKPLKSLQIFLNLSWSKKSFKRVKLPSWRKIWIFQRQQISTGTSKTSWSSCKIQTRRQPRHPKRKRRSLTSLNSCKTLANLARVQSLTKQRFTIRRLAPSKDLPRSWRWHDRQPRSNRRSECRFH